ncbi:MAG TPA: hypothetical protein VGI83_08975, partial [Gemmatimonadales bacterium]
ATLVALGALSASVGRAAAQAGDSSQHAHHAGMSHDSAFAAMQARGQHAMGVDQYTSMHQFEALPDGGRITLERAVDDSAGVAQIRRHMREIAQSFQGGDFSTPFFVHDTVVPGTGVMKAKRGVIAYSAGDPPRGAYVRITTRDPAALTAVHDFLAFQRREHRSN